MGRPNKLDWPVYCLIATKQNEAPDGVCRVLLTELAGELGLSKQNLHRTIVNLAKKGLLKVEGNPYPLPGNSYQIVLPPLLAPYQAAKPFPILNIEDEEGGIAVARLLPPNDEAVLLRTVQGDQESETILHLETWRRFARELFRLDWWYRTGDEVQGNPIRKEIVDEEEAAA